MQVFSVPQSFQFNREIIIANFKRFFSGRVVLYFAQFFQTDKEISEKEMQMVHAAQKDSRFFRKIYEVYFDRIFVYIHRRVRDKELADDLTSQTFYLALIHLHKFNFQGVAFSSWLYKIATNELNMYFRKHKNSTRHVSLSTTGMEQLCMEADGESSSELIEHIATVIGKLSIEEIQLIEWRFYEAYSFKEIAFQLDITEANAKTRTYRLLDKIKQMLPKSL